MSPSDQPEGRDVTVNDELLAEAPFTVTLNGPDVALVGTTATMFVSDQLVTTAVVPFKEIVLLPRVEPKLVPVTATELPTGPELGEMLVTVGAWASVRPAHTRTTKKAAVKDRARLRMNVSSAPTKRDEYAMNRGEAT